MSLRDPIADMIIRIKNSIIACQPTVQIPYSKIKAAIASVLKEEGYILNWEKIGDYIAKEQIFIQLKYIDNKSAIDGLKLVSKLSCRVYVGFDKIPKIMSGLGISILSTSQGIMSDRQARFKKIGGEIICAVW